MDVPKTSVFGTSADTAAGAVLLFSCFHCEKVGLVFAAEESETAAAFGTETVVTGSDCFSCFHCEKVGLVFAAEESETAAAFGTETVVTGSDCFSCFHCEKLGLPAPAKAEAVPVEETDAVEAASFCFFH